MGNLTAKSIHSSMDRLNTDYSGMSSKKDSVVGIDMYKKGGKAVIVFFYFVSILHYFK